MTPEQYSTQIYLRQVAILNSRKLEHTQDNFREALEAVLLSEIFIIIGKLERIEAQLGMKQ